MDSNKSPVQNGPYEDIYKSIDKIQRLLEKYLSNTSEGEDYIETMQNILVDLKATYHYHMNQFEKELANSTTTIDRDQLMNEFSTFRSLIMTALDLLQKHQEAIRQKSKENQPIEYPDVFPTKEDLMGDVNNNNIEPLKITGPYASVKEYLQTQYNLFREDFMSGVREGINEYLKYRNKWKHDRVIVRKNVQVLFKSPFLVLDFASDLRQTMEKKERSLKIRSFPTGGTLIILADEDVKNIICVTALPNRLDDRGYVPVSFHSFDSESIINKTFIAIQFEQYFEPFRRVLDSIRSLSHLEIPMKNSIVYVKFDSTPPAYLTRTLKYKYKYLRTTHEFTPLDTNTSWPPHYHFQLDPSQLKAMKAALTQQFAIIQGPPGTGKTYTALKITEMIVKNAPVTTPILVVSQKNRSLDHFLEGVLNFTTSLVRIGSKCKNRLVLPKTLRKMTKYLVPPYDPIRYTIKNLTKNIYQLQNTLSITEKNIVDKDTLGNVVQILHYKENAGIDPILTWLFDDDINSGIHFKLNIKDDFDVKMECAISDFNKINKLYNVDASSEFKCARDKYGECNKADDVIYKKLPKEEKWRIYFTAVNKLKTCILKKINSLHAEYLKAREEYSRIKTKNTAKIVKYYKIIGMTAAGAAIRHEMLKIIKPQIVIIDEASELMEAQLIACLNKHCEHLILIGDHNQLRPQPESYQLGLKNNLHISLFERMVMNKFEIVTLNTQRRMREEFASLLVPTVYSELLTHYSVKMYEDVVGMKKNMFFLTHSHVESRGNKGVSINNKVEAKWCATLAAYLMKTGGYRAGNITILATYTAQVDLIQHMLYQMSPGESNSKKNNKLLCDNKLSNKLRDIEVKSVDSFQGQENDIIILSLVRSNSDSKLGFLKIKNRLCVALSRAKKGFYLFGNMNQLKTDKVWQEINEKLVDLDAIGPALKLQCPSHSSGSLELELPPAEGLSFDMCECKITFKEDCEK